jgi:hypothetical protein
MYGGTLFAIVRNSAFVSGSFRKLAHPSRGELPGVAASVP